MERQIVMAAMDKGLFMNNKINPCLHCGGAAKVSSCVSKMFIKCKKCGCQFVVNYSKTSKEYLINAWNRVNPDIEMLYEFVDAIAKDAIANPDKLVNLTEINAELSELLEEDGR